MTLCSTLLAAYACVSLSGTQIPISSAPTVNTALTGDGVEVVIKFPGPGTANLGDEEDVGPPRTVHFAICT